MKTNYQITSSKELGNMLKIKDFQNKLEPLSENAKKIKIKHIKIYKSNEHINTEESNKTLASTNYNTIDTTSSRAELKKNKVNRINHDFRKTSNETNLDGLSDEAYLKTLDVWDKIREKKEQMEKITHAHTDKISVRTHSGRRGGIQLHSLNVTSQIMSSLSTLKNKNKNLRDFYKNTDQEQGAILLQNINILKRKFDFEVFKSSKHNYDRDPEEVAETELVKVEKKIVIKRKTSVNSNFTDDDPDNFKVKIEDPYLKFHNLKLEGNYDLLTSTDYYRKIVVDKMKKETTTRKEMLRVATLLHEMKAQKEELLKKNYEIRCYMTEKRQNVLIKKDALSLCKQELVMHSAFKKKK